MIAEYCERYRQEVRAAERAKTHQGHGLNLHVWGQMVLFSA